MASSPPKQDPAVIAASLEAQKLSNAAFNDSIAEAEALLSAGIPIDAKDPDGFTALHRACVKGNVNMINFLLTKGANANVEDGFGDTPLHYACFCGHVEAVRALVKGGADPHKRSNDGKTPLQSAVDENQHAVAQLIQQLTGVGAPAGASAPAAPSFAAPTAPSAPPPTMAKPAPPKAAGGSGFFSKLMGQGAGAAQGGAAAGAQSPMAIAGLDFSRGVIIQGALSKKRANKVLAWRQKYYVLSSLYNALFFWTGTADRVEGVIKKVRFETFLSVKLLPEKKGGRRFDLRVITGRTMNLLAGSAVEAGKWVQVLNEVVGKLMATVRIQATFRGHRARKELRKIEEGRQKVVAMIAGGASGAGAAGAAGDVKMPKGLGQDVSKGKKKKGAKKAGAKKDEDEDAAGPAGPLSADGVLIEGELAKRNHTVMASVFNVYRTRYFVLHRSVGALVYYESKAKRTMGVNPRCIPFVSFYSSLHHLDRKGAKSKAFTLRLVSGRTFVFEARSVEDATQWVSKIDSVLPRDHLAALNIQRFLRGWRARRMVRLLKAKAMEVANAILATYGKGKTMAELTKIVVRLQAYCRMRICRKKFLVMRTEHRKKSGAASLAQPTVSRLNKLSKLSALKRELDAEQQVGGVGGAGKAGGVAGLPLPPPPGSGAGALAMPRMPGMPGVPAGLPPPPGGLPPMPGAMPLPGGVPLPGAGARAGMGMPMPGMPGAAPSMLPPPPSLPPPPMFAPAAPRVKKTRWISQTDAAGRVFYAEVDTGETRWELPREIAAGTARLITGYFSMKDAGSGKKFYVYAPTGATTWETPAGYVSEDEGAAPAAPGAPSGMPPPPPIMGGVVDVSLSAFDREGAAGGAKKKVGAPAGVPLPPAPGAAAEDPLAADRLRRMAAARGGAPAAGPIGTGTLPPTGEILAAPVDPAEAAMVTAAAADAHRSVYEVRSAAQLLALRAVRGSGAGEPPSVPALPHGWVETVEDASGRALYVSLNTGATTYARPPPHYVEEEDEDDDGEEEVVGADPNEVLTFTLWLNALLEGKPGPLAAAVAKKLPISIEEEPPAILAALADGILLCAVTNAIFPGSIDPRAVDVTAVAGQDRPVPGAAPGADGQTLCYSPALENLRLALSAAASAGAQFPKHVSGEALAVCAPRAVMDACYGLMKAKVCAPLDIAGAEGSNKMPTPGITRLAVEGEGVDELLRVPTERLLLRWVNYHLAKVPGGTSTAGAVDAFGASLADGTAVCALVRAVIPDMSKEVPAGDAAVRAVGAEAAVTSALSALFGVGVPAWFSVEGFTEGNARLQLLCFALLFGAAHKLDEPLPPMAKPAAIPASLEMGPLSLTAAPSRSRAWAGGRKVNLVTMPASRALDKELAAALATSTSAAPADAVSGVPPAELAGLTYDARTLSRWANSLGVEGLRVRSSKGLSLLRELKDGIALLKLLDVAEPGIVAWGNVTLAPRSNRAKQTENCNTVVNLGRAMELLNLPGGGKEAPGQGLSSISGQDIADGSGRMTLGFTWQLMRYVTLRQLAAYSAFGADEGELLKWANGCVATAASAVGQPGDLVKIRSFGDAEMKTGMYLLYLLSNLRPGIVDWSVVADGDTKEQQMANALYVLSLARRIGAVPHVAVEDIVEVRPRAIVTLVASMLLAERRAKMGPLAGDGDDEEEEDEEEDEEEEEEE